MLSLFNRREKKDSFKSFQNEVNKLKFETPIFDFI
jgi:hypothetical protein